MFINTTRSGYASTFFYGATILIICAVAAILINSAINNTLSAAGVATISELPGYSWQNGAEELHMSRFLQHVCIVVSFVCLFVMFHVFFYDARQTNELTEAGSSWSKIEQRKYYFPAGRTTDVATINRVTEVKVNETTFDRIFGTGTLELTLTVFLNATEAQMSWTIPGIDNPHEVAQKIRAKSLDHDGARVRMERVDRTT